MPRNASSAAIAFGEHEWIRAGRSYATLENREFVVGQKHIDALRRYSERQRTTPFVCESDRICFRQYVGVLRVGDLTLEILPKADANESGPDDRPRWRSSLIQMLALSDGLEAQAGTTADLGNGRVPLLDHFIRQFLDGLDALIRQGLDKGYETRQEALPVFKGRLLVVRDSRENVARRERVTVEHAPYDLGTTANCILRDGARASAALASSADLRARCRRIFDSLTFSNAPVNEAAISRIPERTRDRYGPTLQLAIVFSAGMAPEVRHGELKVVGLLFDMNKLFEKFVSVQLLRLRPGEIRLQERIPFWKDVVRKPDVIWRNKTQLVVLDAKWKVPIGQPSDPDLNQMFVYSTRLGAHRALLIYPLTRHSMQTKELFAGTDILLETRFLDFFENGRFDVRKVRRELESLLVTQ